MNSARARLDSLRRRGLRGATPRRWAALVIGAIAMLALVSAGTPAMVGSTVSTFVSRPDLRPTIVKTMNEGAAPGYLFLSPATGAGQTPPDGVQTGPLIVDSSGDVVWFAPTGPAGDLNDVATDFKVQRYRGERVLTWWQGDIVVPPGKGRGSYVITDSSYRRVATVRAGNGLRGDLHEFVITRRNTALITIYRTVPTPTGPVTEGVVQELDIETGRVLFEWHSLAHVPLSESTKEQPDDPSTPFDYFHLNSVEVDRDGNLLISARHTSTVYKIDRQTGAVIWRLGGTNSDFEMGPGTDFGFQHDARRHPDGTISIFDNGTPGEDSSSRALVLRVDERAMTAELVREYPSPRGWFSFSQGSAQRLPGGHYLVGWGSESYVTEFDRDGDVVFSAVFGPGMDSYRAYRFRWVGRPHYPPAVTVRNEAGPGLTVYASWNGSTQTTRWQVLAGPSPDRLAPVRTAASDGFETAVEIGTRHAYVAVQALNTGGDVLGTSPPVATTGQSRQGRDRCVPPVPSDSTTVSRTC